MGTDHSHGPLHDTRAHATHRLRIAGTLTLALFGAEVIGGVLSHSLALVSDAGHMLADLFALGLSLLSIAWATKPADRRKTFGYYRIEILASLINAALLLFVAFQIFFEAWHRLKQPDQINLRLMFPIAVAGLLVNVISIFLLRSQRHHLTMRAAFLHVVSDTISSVGVVGAAIIIFFTGMTWVDTALSGLIALLILVSAFRLLREAADILLESSPSHLSLEDVSETIRSVVGVEGLHDLHVWTITSGFHAASAHILVKNMDVSESEKIVSEINQKLKLKFSINHTTLQVGTIQSPARIGSMPG